MILFLLFLVAVGIAIGLAFTLATGVLAVIPAAIALGLGCWIVWTFLAGRGPGRATHEIKPAELLGPGGPDDPDAAPQTPAS